jgi:hypothetical protein
VIILESSHAKLSPHLVVLHASLFKPCQSIEMLFLLIHAVVNLKLHSSVFLSAFCEPFVRSRDTVLKNLLDVLDVVQQDFLSLLLGTRACVYFINFFEVVALISKQLPGHLIRVL